MGGEEGTDRMPVTGEWPAGVIILTGDWRFILVAKSSMQQERMFL